MNIIIQHVSPEHYMNNLDLWAHKEFKAWAKTARKTGDFTPTQATLIVNLFDTARSTIQPISVLHSKLSFYEQHRTLTSTHVQLIESKASEILLFKNSVQLFRDPSPTATPDIPPLPAPPAPPIFDLSDPSQVHVQFTHEWNVL